MLLQFACPRLVFTGWTRLRPLKTRLLPRNNWQQPWLWPTATCWCHRKLAMMWIMCDWQIASFRNSKFLILPMACRLSPGAFPICDSAFTPALTKKTSTDGCRYGTWSSPATISIITLTCRPLRDQRRWRKIRVRQGWNSSQNWQATHPRGSHRKEDLADVFQNLGSRISCCGRHWCCLVTRQAKHNHCADYISFLYLYKYICFKS